MSKDMKVAMKKYNCPETDTKDNYVGIEIEFSCPVPEDQVMDILIEKKLAKYIQIGYDGQPPAGHVGYEWKVLMKESEMEHVLKELGKVIGGLGGMANDSCGLHVHLDMRHRDPAISYNNLVLSQKILYGVAHQRRATSGWCFPSVTHDLSTAAKGKHTGINPHLSAGKNTIEVRIREGIVDTDDIFSWASMLIAIVNNPRIAHSVKTTNDFQEVVAVNAAIKEYMIARIKNNKRDDLIIPEAA